MDPKKPILSDAELDEMVRERDRKLREREGVLAETRGFAQKGIDRALGQLNEPAVFDPTGRGVVSELGVVDPVVTAAIEEQRERDRLRASLDPRFLDSVFNRWSSSGSQGGLGGVPTLPRQFCSFIMSADACTPGVFPSDFEITLGTLTPEIELKAAQASGDPVSMAFHMARASLHAVNGRPIGPGADDFLWNALGTAGRQIVAGMFSRMTGAEHAQGKALATLRVH